MDEKQKLLDELLESVKQCQIRFGGKSELATESEEVIAQLCAKFEAVLYHGLKLNGTSNSALKDFVAKINSSGAGSNVKSPWPFVRLHLNRHELERYMLLKQIKTDSGRARAWLRASLNEHSFERYLHVMINDGDKIEQFYEPFAFIADSERCSMLPQMAAGLNSILFAINIDNETLNHWNATVASVENGVEAILEPKIATTSNESSTGAIKKKKKNSSKQVITFDENEIKTKLTINSVIKESKLQDTTRAMVHNQDESDLSSPNMTYDDVHLDANHKNAGDDSPSDRVSLLSVDTSGQGPDDDRTKLTPMRNSEVGALIPLSPNSHDDVMSEDSMSIKSFGEDQDYASAMSSIAQTPQPVLVTGAPSSFYNKSCSSVSSVTSAQNSTLSREDLKQALLSVMERKEELQDQCQGLKQLLEQESSTSAGLRQELNEANRKSKDSCDKLQARVNSILRENELLKHQLKKYVGAVQKLRDGPQAHETLAHLEGQESRNNPDSKYVDYHFEASEYEKKLIQVAEMHGEVSTQFPNKLSLFKTSFYFSFAAARVQRTLAKAASQQRFLDPATERRACGSSWPSARSG